MQPHQEPVTFENFMYGPVCNREGGISDGMRAQLPEATRDEYDSIQKVCAAALFGGHPRSNLGMVCYHNPWPNGNPIPVFRADYRDMALVQSQNGIVLEMWCQIYCSCEEVPDHLKNMPEAMPEINDLYLAEAYEQLMNDKSHLRIAEIEKANPGYKYNPKSGGSSYSVNTRSGQRISVKGKGIPAAEGNDYPSVTVYGREVLQFIQMC
ncbi:MAG: hypothetical protein M1824_001794 [Vezdaea acicularis]|nr:MAG: hypothetical protein M1824_001794 [Vezdaea acicularis]